MSAGTSEILRADSIVVHIGDRRILSAATLRANAGHVTVLFGCNGAGKTTLLDVACGLRRATAGVVVFQGRAFERPFLPRMARDGLFVLPDRELLTPSVTIRGHLELVAARFGGRDIEDAAALVGITDRLDQRADACSTGERRLAEAAMVWLRAPTCLLADEPLRDVAPIVAETLCRVFRAMANDGCAVVLTGHDAETLLGVADRVVWCTSGTTYELGSPDTARMDPKFRAEYLASKPLRPDGSKLLARA